MTLDVSGSSVLVAGGSGFVGSGVVRRLVELGADVTSVSRSGKQQASDGVSCEMLDLRDSEASQRFLKTRRFKTVINCCGYLGDTDGFEGEEDILSSHFLATRNLVAALNWRPIRAFVHIGSAKEYGNVPMPASEDMKPQPNTPYGFAKLAASEYVLMRARLHNWPVLVVRPSSIYGPGQRSGLIPYVLERALADEAIELTTGQQRIDFIHASDVVSGILCAATAVFDGGRIYNLGSGIGHSVREVVGILCELAGGGKPIWEGRPRRSSEPEERILDIRRAKEELGWLPRVSLREGLRELVDRKDRKVRA